MAAGTSKVILSPRLARSQNAKRSILLWSVLAAFFVEEFGCLRSVFSQIGGCQNSNFSQSTFRRGFGQSIQEVLLKDLSDFGSHCWKCANNPWMCADKNLPCPCSDAAVGANSGPCHYLGNVLPLWSAHLPTC